MIEEIRGAGFDGLDRLVRTGKSQKGEADSPAQAPSEDQDPAEALPSELRELIDRIKHADGFRKERVHQVLEKLQSGELVTSETVREAAERILREGI